MKLIKPSYEILTDIDGDKILKDIEAAARTCYKSEDKIEEGSAAILVAKLLKRGHMAMLEMADIMVRFVCNRGFTHEMVRHRLCSFAQESTRYCNYSKDKHNNQITCIIAPHLSHLFNEDGTGEKEGIVDEGYNRWWQALCNAEADYLGLLELGWSPQQARGVLPIDIKTEIVAKANVREWMHIFSQRTSPAAHPSMHELMRPLQKELQTKIPLIFNEMHYEDK